MTIASVRDVINSLTLVVTPSDCTSFDLGNVPSLMNLRGTFQDANLVDRVLFVDYDGREAYIKDRFPAAHMPEDVTVLDHKINRPCHLLRDGWSTWCKEVLDLRMQLRLTGSIELPQ